VAKNAVAYKIQWPIKYSGLQNTVAYKTSGLQNTVAYKTSGLQNQWPIKYSGLQNAVIISVFLYTVCPNQLYSIPHTTETLQSFTNPMHTEIMVPRRGTALEAAALEAAALNVVATGEAATREVALKTAATDV